VHILELWAGSRNSCRYINAAIKAIPAECAIKGAIEMFNNIRADLRTYKYDIFAQGFLVMLIYRFGRWRYGIKVKILRIPFSFAYKILFKITQVFTGIEFPCEVKIGKDFKIDHFSGIIVSGYASFGDNCIIRNGVTVGLKNLKEPCGPSIGDNVDIGAGAKVLGPIKIGNNVTIGANAVVITDVPDNSIAVGVPAKVISKKS